MKVKMSVAFDSKSSDVEYDNWNLIESSNRQRSNLRFQNPGKSKHFPFTAVLRQIFTDRYGEENPCS